MDEPKELGTLIVVVGKARNLVNKSRFGKQDPFCTVILSEEKQKTKPIKRGGQHPEWDEELRFTIMEDIDDVLARSDSTADSLASSTNSVTSLSKVDSPGVTTAQALATKSRKGPINKKGGKSIKVSCFADDAKEPELIGECMVPIDEVLKKGEVDEWYEFLYKDKYSGEIYLELTFYSNDAPPVKRNVPRPSVSQFGGFDGGASSSASHHRLSNSISTSGSVSGMSLYIPPYVKPPMSGIPAAQTPIPPAASSSFSNLGLPAEHIRHQTPVPGSYQNGYPQAQSLPQHPSQNLSVDALTRPLSSMSIGSNNPRPLPPPTPTPQQQQSQQQYAGHGWGHRHSVGSSSEAPWGSLLPQSQPPPAPTPHPRPMSTNDVIPWDQQRVEEDRRLGGATPVPRPGTGQAYHVPPVQHSDPYRQPSPIPTSLLPGGPPPPPKQHANSFSGVSGPPPSQTFHLQSPAPDPIPHSNSAPPTSPHSGYYGVPSSSFAGIAQSLNQPSGAPNAPGGYGYQQDQYNVPSSSGYQQTPPRQDFQPQSSYGTPTKHSPYPPPHRNSLPDPSTHQSPPPPTPPRDNGYNQQPQQPNYGYEPQPPPPSQTPTPMAPGGYVPWYQQTQAAQPPPAPPIHHTQSDPYPPTSSYGSPPPPVPGRRPIPNPPAPPKSSVGYYPSDELYAQQHQQQTPSRPSSSWQNPQGSAYPQQSDPYPQQSYQSQPPQSHQPYGGQSNSSSPFTPHQQYSNGPSPTPAPLEHRHSIGYQPSSSQGYGRSPSPAPPPRQPSPSPTYQQPYGGTPSPQPPIQSHSPSPYYNQPPGQNQNPGPSQLYPPRTVSPQPPPQNNVTPTQLYPPSDSTSSYNYHSQNSNGSRSPSPSPAPTSRQDWKSYMQNLSVGQQQQQQAPAAPIRSPSPQPPAKEWYTPPPNLPPSIRPPEGWKSTLPADSPGHSWGQ